MTLIILCLLTLIGAFVYLFPRKMRPYYILILSILFFFCISPSALFGVVFVAIISYIAAHTIYSVPKKTQKKLLLGTISILFSGILVFIKYSGFFLADSIAVPMGLSYYTLMAIGGLIDIYRRKTEPEKNFILHMLYLCFFPQVMAGPIGRIQNLKAQFKNPTPFDALRMRRGFLMVLLGLLYKMVVADTLLIPVNYIYESDATGWIIFVAMLLYASVLYFDFCGYSMIAVGAAHIMGVELIMNFDTPYTACSMQQFWRQWHISLSSWFRDYVYFPLGGSKKGAIRRDLNTLIIFTLSGAWHGNFAGYILWGGIHGIYLIIGKHTLSIREKMSNKIRSKKIYRYFQRFIVYVLFSLSMFPFYCKTLWQTRDLIIRFFTKSSGLSAFAETIASYINLDTATLTAGSENGLSVLGYLFLMVCLFATLGVLIIDWLIAKYNLIHRVVSKKTLVRYAVYLLLFLLIVVLGQYGSTYNQADFIYGQF